MNELQVLPAGRALAGGHTLQSTEPKVVDKFVSSFVFFFSTSHSCEKVLIAIQWHLLMAFLNTHSSAVPEVYLPEDLWSSRFIC